MAIKKLQNDFTTPEQSKRLLELGVPADSADCYICKVGNLYNATVPQIRRDSDASICLDTHLPIWSVGRLMEIYDTCRCYEGDWDEVYEKETYIETYVSAIEEALLDDMFDFSKLEE